MHIAEGLSSELAPGHRLRLQKAMDFWAGLPDRVTGVGGTRDGVLEGLRAEFDDLLAGGEPIDLNLVESLVAQAALSLLGKRAF